MTTTFPIEGAQALGQLNLTGVDIHQYPTSDAFLSFNFSDGTGFTPIGRDKAGTTRSRTTQFTDNITFRRGKHTTPFGLDLRDVLFGEIQTNIPSDDFGLFTFNQGVFTGNAFGDFLLGIPNTEFFAVTSPDDTNVGRELAFYGQDEWQVNSHLTVNFGLRWQLSPRFIEKNKLLALAQIRLVQEPLWAGVVFRSWRAG